MSDDHRVSEMARQLAESEARCRRLERMVTQPDHDGPRSESYELPGGICGIVSVPFVTVEWSEDE